MLAALCWITARSLLFCECPGEGWPEGSVLHILHSFVGHMCHAVGALLTNQLGIQILTGAYMAAADIVRFLLTLFPVCPSEALKTAGQQGSAGLCPGAALCPHRLHGQDPLAVQSMQGKAMSAETAVGHPLLGRSRRPVCSSDCVP
ncbi:transmembrane protein 44 [Apteryx mantelli]|uniref:Transmembrane protein 44 n=1 Tax=Apteryx mantelli TaxID=2696672 RepID=A0ABM4EXY6_9AVES